MSQRNVSKLECLAKRKGPLPTVIVREVIEAYDPERQDVLGEQELMNLVATRLKYAIKETRQPGRNYIKLVSVWGRSNGWMEGAVA